MAGQKRIGILGGGQLGRMLAFAARDLNLTTHIFCPEKTACALEVADKHTLAAYEDKAALEKFAQENDIITFEFENIPLESATFLHKLKPEGFFPSPQALAITQDRKEEKTFLNALGIRTAKWTDNNPLPAAMSFPVIVKTRRFGYDGKGQRVARTPQDLPQAIETLSTAHNGGVIIESQEIFDKEIAFVCARSPQGEIMFYPPVETFHRDGILREAHAPAIISPALKEEGLALVRTVAEQLDYVGVLAVETFKVGEALCVNELAPRVHNSYHWTIEGTAHSQFTQHLRAISSMPLASPLPIKKSRMINLIGADDWRAWQNEPNTFIHLYDKGEARDGRKMGHITQILD